MRGGRSGVCVRGVDEGKGWEGKRDGMRRKERMIVRVMDGEGGEGNGIEER